MCSKFNCVINGLLNLLKHYYNALYALHLAFVNIYYKYACMSVSVRKKAFLIQRIDCYCLYLIVTACASAFDIV